MRTLAIVLLSLVFAVPAMAYDFTDVVKGLAPGGQGVEDAIEAVMYARTFVHLRETNQEAAELFSFLEEALRGADLKTFYKSKYSRPWSNGYKGACFRGLAEPGKIDFDIIDRDAALNGLSSLSGYGSFLAEFGLRKNDSCPAGGGSWSLASDGDAISGDQSWKTILRLIDNLLTLLEPDNIDALAKGAKLLPGEKYDLMNAFERAFPRFSIEEKVLKVEATPVIRTHDGVRYTDFTLKVGYKPEELAHFFPNIAKYAKRLRGLGRIEASMLNQSGHSLADVVVDGEEEAVTLRVAALGGKVIPMTRPAIYETPNFDEAVRPGKLDMYQFTVKARAVGKAKGLKVRVDDILVLGAYASSDGEMRFTTRMGGVPRIQVTGALYGFIPIGIINLFIPGTMDSLAEDFATVMYKANSGDGTFFKVDWNLREPDKNWLHWKARTEIWDKSYIRAGAKAFSKKFAMDKKTIAEFDRILKTALDLMLKDLQAMQG